MVSVAINDQILNIFCFKNMFQIGKNVGILMKISLNNQNFYLELEFQTIFSLWISFSKPVWNYEEVWILNKKAFFLKIYLNLFYYIFSLEKCWVIVLAILMLFLAILLHSIIWNWLFFTNTLIISCHKRILVKDWQMSLLPVAALLIWPFQVFISSLFLVNRIQPQFWGYHFHAAASFVFPYP